VVDDLTADDGVVRAEVTRQGLLEPVDLASHPALGHLGEDGRITVPEMSASMISREDTLQTAEATEVSLMPASWSTFSRRWIALARESTWVLR